MVDRRWKQTKIPIVAKCRRYIKLLFLTLIPG
jgi:hypothetical protein